MVKADMVTDVARAAEIPRVKAEEAVGVVIESLKGALIRFRGRGSRSAALEC